MTIVYRSVDLKDIMPKLREELEGRGDVVIAVVFGSAIRRRLVRDLDIAVYFEGRPSKADLEAGRRAGGSGQHSGGPDTTKPGATRPSV